MEKSKKALPIMLATALATTPFVIAPQSASAITDISIDPDDDEAGESTKYTIEFTLEEDLKSGDKIYVKFPKQFDIDSDIDEDDIDADFKVKEVSVSGREITIKVGEKLEADDEISFDITDGITNPDDKGTYSIEIRTSNESKETEDVKITSGSSSNSGSKKGSSDDYSVDIDDTTEKKETQYEIGPIKLDDKLVKGDWITVTFPSSDMLPSKISKDDVDINEYEPDSVSVSGKKVEIKVPSKVDGKKELTLKFYKSAGIKNPSAGDKYTIDVKWDGVTYQSEKFDIKKSGSSSSSSTASDFTVSLSDSSAGARTSYTFEADFGKTELKADSEVIIEFPSSDMIPGYLNPDDFRINGKTVRKVGSSGNKISLTTPYNFSSSKTVKVDIDFNAWITNPKSAGDYTLKMTVDGKTATSKTFRINGAGAVTPTPTPTPTPTTPGTTAPANNSTATITLTNTAVGKQTGVNIAVKAFGAPLVKQRDFIEVVFPVGYKVPAYIAPASVSVNGVAASFVAVRGQNVLVYPAQDIAAGTGANIVIGAAANIVNPAAKNTYTINVFSSEEKGLLFGRAVGVGVPQPAQPAQPAPQPAPQQPQQPQQPQTAVPANAALFKVNNKSFTLHGKVYPLQEAPYLANGNTTMVPAQFFKEAMALTTQWNNQTVAIIKGRTVVRFTVDSNKAYVGSQEFTLPAPVALKNGMPMVPIRFVTDNLGYKVGWDAKTSSVFVYQ
ncbi:copper amine oxidase N-terminal domain-containing protein [Brevibacillus borstelensis]|uniref:copper amine oxidase N-terminal domain-containing protein n=1 Tax=Brevibacillus borstelensis TaxID=45462 RepID=UPI00203E0A90|nr:copper amine oxidase N-terminal domain-containing protein [Brevibacillus borstelensis]MCM3557479.1 copper amine oxidase N-terminal domain-containing protein [Brevibacillus borstelensis]MCM3589489.1 copper amine oxidase N-terminal domain-containing protein [Brevibacillus borstelensis]